MRYKIIIGVYVFLFIILNTVGVIAELNITNCEVGVKHYGIWSNCINGTQNRTVVSCENVTGIFFNDTSKTNMTNLSDSFLNLSNSTEFQKCDTIILSVFSPNKSIYNYSQILFNLTTSLIADEIIYIDHLDKKPKWKLLCSQCDDYSKLRILSNDNHSITFRAFKDEQRDEFNVSFLVDDSAPRLYSLSSLKNAYLNNRNFFSITYDEGSLKRVNLTMSDGQTKSNQTCRSGRRQTCTFTNIALNESYDRLYYYFELEDSAGHISRSRIDFFNVDVTKPIFNSIINRTIGNILYLSLDITEKNLDNIIYRDNSELLPRNKTLCTRLKRGVCETKKIFRAGQHNLDIFVLDKAGNSAKGNVSFVI